MKAKKPALKYDEDQFHTPFEYINKDLDLLFILIFLEASHTGQTRLNFGSFFKGNYWDIDDIKSEVSDTNDYDSIPDMVYSQATFLFNDLRMGNVTHVGIDDTQRALEDALVAVAKIGAENAEEQARNFTETVRQICKLEYRENEWYTNASKKEIEKLLEKMRTQDHSVLFPFGDNQSLKTLQAIVIDLPEHIVMDVLYDEAGIENIEQEIGTYLRGFANDEFLEKEADYQPKRHYFAKQLESFCTYLNTLPFIDKTVNIPFSILAKQDFEAVKLLKYLQSRDALKMRWSDDVSWRITDEMYDNFLREYKSKQAELLDQMQDHSDADEQFYVTANMTLNLAKRAKSIFKSSEVEEKQQFLAFLLQNCTLHEEKLAFTMRSPFDVMFSNTHHMTMRRGRDSNSRYLAVCRVSKPVLSTTQPPLLMDEPCGPPPRKVAIAVPPAEQCIAPLPQRSE